MPERASIADRHAPPAWLAHRCLARGSAPAAWATMVAPAPIMVAPATIMDYYRRVVTDEFRALMQEFVRQFGLLSADRTPCGKPLASSDAHALMVLLDAGEDRGMPCLARSTALRS